MQKFAGAVAAVLFGSALLATTACPVRAAENTSTHRSSSARSTTTISGSVIAVNGDLVQFREDNGATISLNQSALLDSGMSLTAGGHYSLRGYWSNDMFVAQANGADYGNNNGYPYGGSTSIHGVITSISGNRVTLLQSLFSTITVDDQQALNNGSAQDLYVGRSVTAFGFWNGSVFYATTIG
jgi:hypothetical protein